jgi:hypothetical protein
VTGLLRPDKLLQPSKVASFSDKSLWQSSLLVERFIYDIRRHQSPKDMAPTRTNSRPNKMSLGAIGLFVLFVIIESGCLITRLSAG